MLLEITHQLAHHAALAPAVLFGFVLRDCGFCRAGNRLMHRLQARLRVLGTVHQRIASKDARIGLSCASRCPHHCLGALVFPHPAGAHHRNFTLVGLPKQVQSLVGFAVQRVLVNQRAQAGDRRRIGFAQIIKTSDAEFPLSDHFLHFQ